MLFGARMTSRLFFLFCVIPLLPSCASPPSSSGISSESLRSGILEEERVVGGGGSEACEVRSNGELSCWNGDDGIPAAPAGQLFKFLPPAVGPKHVCAIRTDDDIQGETFTQISTGYMGVCGLHADGTASCWEIWDWDVVDRPPADERFLSIDARGYQFMCGLHVDHTVRCWGRSHAHVESTFPSGRFRQLAATVGGACAVTEDGLRTVCWGDPRIALPDPRE